MPRHPAESSAHASGLLRALPQMVAKPSGAAKPGLHALGSGGKRDGAYLIPDGLDASKPAPLVLAFHGAGGVASQMVDLLRRVAEMRGIVVVAPESRGSTWDVIRGGYGADVAHIDQALHKVFQVQAIDPERMAMTGFSDGASYALSLGLINGMLFNHVLAFSPGFMAPTQQNGKPRIFISHGVHDEVLPIDPCSRRLVPALRRQSYDVDYVEFDDGHIVPPDMVERAVNRFLG